MKPIPNTSTSYRQLPFVTIDGESTRDIDDALHIERQGNGYRVVVAIANPVRLVPIGSTEDMQARLIAATAYIRDRAVRRMLPPAISEHQGSLVVGQERAALVFDIILNDTLEPVSTTIAASPITVAHRLSHPDIAAIVGDAAHPLRIPMTLASTLGRLLLDSRRRHGALALYDLSRLLLTDEEGQLHELHSVEEVIGYIIVQEIMILTNHETSKWMIERNIPCIFRNHEPRLAAPRSDELAATIEIWMRGASFDTLSVRSQFAAIAGRAQYGASTKGHYGLSLPSYVHITSPLRRYADLVNMRQLVAHLKGQSFPYEKDALASMSADLNDAIEKRKEERSEGFKVVVRRTAERALNNGQLAKLADHELRQAIKLAHDTGYLPEALAAEVACRLDSAIATDILVNTVLMDVPSSVLTDGIRSAMSRWLADDQSRAMKIINHGRQTGFFVEATTESAAAGETFIGTVSLMGRDGHRASAKGRSARKRDSEQAAALCALTTFLGLPAADVGTPNAGSAATAAIVGHKNYKGILQELCQKHKWQMPIFEASGKGPAHSMIFSASARVAIAGTDYCGQADHAPTKKDAESAAAERLLEKLKTVVPTGPTQATGMASVGNPVGALQEIAQKSGFAPPSYEFIQVSEAPPLFRCAVTTHGGRMGTFSGEASTKQAAKAQAAATALAPGVEE